MLERRNFPALEHAIEQYTRSGGELKARLKGALYYLLKMMAAAVKTDFIINQQDAKTSEIEKFVVVLEMHHTSLFGNATYQVNMNRQTKLRGPQSLPSDNTVAKVREFTVATINAIIANHREKVLPSPVFTLLRDLALFRLTLFNFRRGGEPTRLALSDWSDARHDMWIDQDSHCQTGQMQGMICGSTRTRIVRLVRCKAWSVDRPGAREEDGARRTRDVR